MRKTASAMAITLTALSIQPFAVYCADNTKIGFGQGTSVDSANRPTDALSFNSRYGELDAYALSDDDKRIIITFDQGYENGYTEKILDTLKEKNVKAIFFLTGDYAKKETALVKRMIEEGHVLGNHGMTHASLPTLSESEAEKEIMSLHDYVMNNYGYQMQYFRCPCGEYSEAALETVQNAGYKPSSGVLLMWTGKPTVSPTRRWDLKSSQILLTAERSFFFIPFLQQMQKYLATLSTISEVRVILCKKQREAFSASLF